MSGYAAPWGKVARVVLVPNHTPETRRLAQIGSENIKDKLHVPVLVHPTAAGGLEANQELFDSILEEGDVVGGYFGDGTARDLLLAIGTVPFISLGGGNARDIGRATHRFRNASPSWLIKHSAQVTGYALNCCISRDGETVRREHAISYIGTGESAAQTAFLATDEYRNALKVMRDVRVATDVITSDRWFELVDNDGEERRLSDLTFSKGSRMAKITRFPINHWDPEFRVTPVDAGKIAKVWGSLGILAGQAAGLTQAEPYTFNTLSDTLMHFDGEPPIPVAAQSEVTVSLHERTYNLLTTRAHSL